MLRLARKRLSKREEEWTTKNVLAGGRGLEVDHDANNGGVDRTRISSSGQLYVKVSTPPKPIHKQPASSDEAAATNNKHGRKKSSSSVLKRRKPLWRDSSHSKSNGDNNAGPPTLIRASKKKKKKKSKSEMRETENGGAQEMNAGDEMHRPLAEEQDKSASVPPAAAQNKAGIMVRNDNTISQTSIEDPSVSSYVSTASASDGESFAEDEAEDELSFVSDAVSSVTQSVFTAFTERNALVERVVCAPPGRLDIAIDDSSTGPIINEVKGTSPMEGVVFAGDRIVAIDDKDIRGFSCADTKKLMAESSDRDRKITVLSVVKKALTPSPPAAGSKAKPIFRREYTAPPGKVGVVIGRSEIGPVVNLVKPGSPLMGKLHEGDRIIAIDDVDTRWLGTMEVTRVMAERKGEERRIVVLSDVPVEEGEEEQGAGADACVPSASADVRGKEESEQRQHDINGSSGKKAMEEEDPVIGFRRTSSLPSTILEASESSCEQDGDDSSSFSVGTSLAAGTNVVQRSDSRINGVSILSNADTELHSNLSSARRPSSCEKIVAEDEKLKQIRSRGHFVRPIPQSPAIEPNASAEGPSDVESAVKSEGDASSFGESRTRSTEEKENEETSGVVGEDERSPVPNASEKDACNSSYDVTSFSEDNASHAEASETSDGGQDRSEIDEKVFNQEDDVVEIGRPPYTYLPPSLGISEGDRRCPIDQDACSSSCNTTSLFEDVISHTETSEISDAIQQRCDSNDDEDHSQEEDILPNARELLYDDGDIKNERPPFTCLPSVPSTTEIELVEDKPAIESECSDTKSSSSSDSTNVPPSDAVKEPEGRREGESLRDYWARKDGHKTTALRDQSDNKNDTQTQREMPGSTNLEKSSDVRKEGESLRDFWARRRQEWAGHQDSPKSTDKPKTHAIKNIDAPKEDSTESANASTGTPSTYVGEDSSGSSKASQSLTRENDALGHSSENAETLEKFYVGNTENDALSSLSSGTLDLSSNAIDLPMLSLGAMGVGDFKDDSPLLLARESVFMHTAMQVKEFHGCDMALNGSDGEDDGQCFQRAYIVLSGPAPGSLGQMGEYPYKKYRRYRRILKGAILREHWAISVPLPRKTDESAADATISEAVWEVKTNRGVRRVHEQLSVHLEMGRYEEAMNMLVKGFLPSLYSEQQEKRNDAETYNWYSDLICATHHNIAAIEIVSGIAKLPFNSSLVDENHFGIASLMMRGIAFFAREEQSVASDIFGKVHTIIKNGLVCSHDDDKSNINIVAMGKSLNNLGCSLYAQQEFEEARLAFQRALCLLGGGGSDGSSGNGQILQLTKALEDSMSEMEIADSANYKLVIWRSISMAIPLCNIAKVLIKLEHYSEASATLKPAEVMVENIPGCNSRMVASVKRTSADLSRLLDQHSDALKSYESLLQLLEERVEQSSGASAAVTEEEIIELLGEMREVYRNKVNDRMSAVRCLRLKIKHQRQLLRMRMGQLSDQEDIKALANVFQKAKMQ